MKKKRNPDFPQPVRLDPVSKAQLDKLSKDTGLTGSALIRMSTRYVLPKLLSGELSLKDFGK